MSKKNVLSPSTIAVLAASTLTVMAGSAIAPALPDIYGAYQYENNAGLKVRMAIGLSALFTMICSLFIGKWSDKADYIFTLKVGLVLVLVSATIGVTAPNLTVFLLSRCVLGIGVAAVAISTTAWIGVAFSGKAQNIITGFYGAIMESSGLIYFALAGVLAVIHWRAVVLIYFLPIIILPFLPKVKKIDTSKNNQVIKKYYHKAYLYILCGCSFFILAGLNAYVTQIPFVLENFNKTSVFSGFSLALASLSAGVASLIFSRLMPSLGYSGILILSFLVNALGFFVLSFLYSEYLILFGLLLCGFSFGLAVPAMIGGVNFISHDKNRGDAQSRLAFSGFAGQFISPIYVEWLGSEFSMFFVFITISIIMVCIAFFIKTYGMRGK